jgi:hypothetical protein
MFNFSIVAYVANLVIVSLFMLILHNGIVGNFTNNVYPTTSTSNG